MTELAAYLICFILVCLAIFQIALILGAPLGKFAWGGYHEVLPQKLRIGSAIAIITYVIFAIFVLEQVGSINVLQNAQLPQAGVWAMVGYFALGIPLNAISKSKPERMVMTPVVMMLFLLSIFVAVYGT